MAQDQLPAVAIVSAGLRERISAALAAPVDIAGLAYFRIILGLVVAWEAWRYLSLGWVEALYVGRPFTFGYWPFTFVTPWPGGLMELHFIVFGVTGLMMALGLYYRLAAVVTFLGVVYFFLLDKANYLNHIYLLSLLTFLMILLPAHRTWSLDARRKPELRSSRAPAWTLWIIRFQLALPYFFGGIAKINSEWLRGEPLRMWLARKTDFPLIGRFFTAEPMVVFMTLGALVLDLSVVFLLLFRRTRPFAYAAAVVFHFMNSRLFSIGIFPWLMIAGTALFFPPDWPRRILEDLRRRPGHLRSVAWWAGAGFGAGLGWTLPGQFAWPQVALGGLGGAIALYGFAELRQPSPAPVALSEPSSDVPPRYAGVPASRRLARPLAIFLAVWVGVHLLVPLRHLAVPGHVLWTEEGQRFSWMMLLRSKAGRVDYVLTEPSTGETWVVEPARYLSPKQIQTLSDKPDMVLQFAHYLRDRLRDEGFDGIEIRARTVISLNGMSPRPIIDPEADLSQVPFPWFGPADWILPKPEA